jgi:hypothetical protein
VIARRVGRGALRSARCGSSRRCETLAALNADNGADFVHDLRQSDHDRIDVSAYGFESIADLTFIDTGADTRIEFDATNSVTLVGFGDPGVLQASDFIFA